MSTQEARKLISISGYWGFVAQLKVGERLVVKHKTQTGEFKVTELGDEDTFERVVQHKLRAQEIGGFYAVAEKIPQVLASPSAAPSSEMWRVDSVFLNVYRPVEQLVMGAIDLKVPAISLLSSVTAPNVDRIEYH